MIQELCPLFLVNVPEIFDTDTQDDDPKSRSYLGKVRRLVLTQGRRWGVAPQGARPALLPGRVLLEGARPALLKGRVPLEDARPALLKGRPCRRAPAPPRPGRPASLLPEKKRNSRS